MIFKLGVETKREFNEREFNEQNQERVLFIELWCLVFELRQNEPLEFNNDRIPNVSTTSHKVESALK